ncbi:TolB family protein, partial [Amphibacillus sediminis]|uniref:TolB family protein n=1 Tax=Amphibacillus sediminis TaxID=360185 RepID=UPI003570A3A0
PEDTCIWYVNLENGRTKEILKYTDFYNFETRQEMMDAEHKINHIMINPSGNRFMVLHRWLKGNQKFTRLLTVNIDGTGMYNLSDDNMTSHCCWKNDDEILGYARKQSSGNGYYLMKDKSQKFKQLWSEVLTIDGHPSYSPDGKHIVTDTYPNRARIGTVYVGNEDKIEKVARVYAPFKYDNDFRCDLHPRWSRNGNKISIDSTFEGKRCLYIIDIEHSCK